MLLAPEATLRDGRYRLERRLGFGGMATVWLADDCRLGRPVAVKILSEQLATDAEYVLRFQREARVAAQLSHPNLVRLYDYGTEDGRPFLVSEWIDGPDLHELRRGGEPVDVEVLAADLLTALDYIHRAGIIHRDVKPSNVLVGQDGRARLTDFGIAQPEDATRLTETGMVLGTRSYIAPEVMRGERATPSADLYAAGVVLSEEIDESSPSQLRRLVNWLSAAEPGARPESAADALELIEPAAPAPTRRMTPSAPPTEPAAPPPPSRATEASLPEFRPEPYRRPRSGPRLAAILGAALVIGALAVLVIAIAGGGSDDEGGPPEQASSGGAGQQDQQASAAGTPGNETAPSEPTVSADTAIPPPDSNPDPAKGAALNDEGFALIGAGDYDKAIKVLEKAVAEFPESERGTTEYAYALYNLGDAYLQAGQPETAIPILEERLKIPNQTPTVQETLDEARAAAGE
jgi:eukaryotic-like serine/threonine-protein kinase